MDERNLHNNAVCTEWVARACSDLAAIEDAMPKMPEKDLIRAHQSARLSGGEKTRMSSKSSPAG